MMAGRQERFAIEADVEEELDGWVLGHFRFWLCGRPVGNWDDTAELRSCVHWLRDFATGARHRFEPDLVDASAEEVFRQLYDPVMAGGSGCSPYEDPYSRFHISYIGMSSFELFDILLLHDAHGEARCLWRRAGAPAIEECRLGRGEMESVATEFCALFDRTVSQ